MKILKLVTPGVGTLLAMNIGSSAAAPLHWPVRGFVSSQPARSWEEGLLCGNGTIGANMLGHPLHDRIILTHERLFLPMGPPFVPRDQSAHLPKIRELIRQGRYREATELQFELSGQSGFLYPEYFVPACDLVVRTPAVGAVRDYLRSVNFETGEATVRWSDDRGVVERRLFVSRADAVVVFELRGSGRGMLECELALEPREPSDYFNADRDISRRSDDVFREHVCDVRAQADTSSLMLFYRFSKAYPGSLQALDCVARVIVTGGTSAARPNGVLAVKEADHVLVLLALSPNRETATPRDRDMLNVLARLPADYATLLDRHARRHGALFNRVRLNLGGAAGPRRTTEELLAASRSDSPDPALIELVFDAGRYNIISSTGELPPNLQGVWAGIYTPPWASDYTHNGNLPCAIAANLMGHLPELMLAYVRYVESLVPHMEINARHLFGARGIVLPSRTSTHGYNNALAPDFAGGFWVAGAGWAAHVLYDYYQYTGDRSFLADHALPFMEKVAQFFEDYLVEGPDGKWIFSPGQSPENTPANSDSQGTFNATMDVAVAKELFRNLIAASRELGCNREHIPRWERVLEKMPEYMVDERGLLKEWLTPRLENNDRHRHASHLYALFDGLPEEIANNPRLRDAVRRSIEFKLDHYWRDERRGFMAFGLVQLGLAAASLGNRDLAFRSLTLLVNGYWLNNMASTHNCRELFNMDLSGGLPALVIKMLVASEPGRIRLLPALPPAWPSGSIEGVLCRGQIEVQRLEWNNDGLTCVLRSAIAQTVVLELPAPILSATVNDTAAKPAGEVQCNQWRLSLPAGTPMSVRIVCDVTR